MKKTDYILKSFLNAAGVFIYVFTIVLFIFNGQKFFDKEPNVLIPLFMLLLLVVSASVTGLLVLGKPIYLYLEGFKKESFIFLFSTLAWLVLFLISILFFVFFKRVV